MADKKIPLYECKVNPDVEDETGVFRVSFVTYPAIESGFVKLKKADRVPVVLSNEKQIVTGPALIPDKEIFRMGPDGPYFIKFTAEAIEQISRKFLKQGKTNETNLEHEIPLEGNTVVESWIEVKDGKAAKLGMEVPAGTWMLSVHVPDATLWEEEIKSGKRTGFSIEGIFDYVQVAELKKQHKKQNSDMKNLFARLGKGRKVQKLGAATLEDGRAIQWDDETLEVWFVNEAGERGEALPDGTYTTSEGSSLTVAGGKIEEVTEPAPAPEEMHTVVLENGRIIDIDPGTLEAFSVQIGEDGSVQRSPLQDGEYYTLDWYHIIIAGGKFVRDKSSYPFVAEAPAETVTNEGEQMSALILSLREQGEKFEARAKDAEAKLATVTKERDEYKTTLSKTPGAPKIDTTPGANVRVKDGVKMKKDEAQKTLHRTADIFAKKGKSKAKTGE